MMEKDLHPNPAVPTTNSYHQASNTKLQGKEPLNLGL